jgi:hypothetical protein
VADRADGYVLRSTRYCLDGGGTGEEGTAMKMIRAVLALVAVEVVALVLIGAIILLIVAAWEYVWQGTTP